MALKAALSAEELSGLNSGRSTDILRRLGETIDLGTRLNDVSSLGGTGGAALIGTANGSNVETQLTAPTTTSDRTVAVTAADQAQNVDLTINHATADAVGVDVTAVQLTTARSSGNVSAFRGSTTSLAGDSGGVYSTFHALAPTDGGGSAVHNVLLVGAGYDAFVDLSACATGEADVVLGDNLALALQIRQGANAYLDFITTNDAERIRAQKLLSYAAPTVVDMADAAHTLVLGTAGAAQTKLTSNIVLVDPNSGGASENFQLPAAASCAGLELTIINTGGEGIVVQGEAAATVITLDTAQHGKVVSSGTAWYGFMGGVT